MTTSSIQLIGGVPTLTVNNQPIPNIAYMTYYTHRAAYTDFTEIGFRLFSFPVFFGGRTINPFSQIPPFKPGIFDQETPNFSIFDQDVRDILAACPEAMIFPRVNLSLPLSWDEAHPEELCDTAPNGRLRTCFSSDLWAAETKRLLKLFIDHIKASDFCDHIVGYQLAGGTTEEWMSFDGKGSIGKRSREAFARYCTEHELSGTQEEYYAFLSHMTAQRILEFAHYIKEETAHQLVVGTFYGYTLECPNPTSTHHALAEILNSTDIDFICSPVSYMDLRPVGQDHPNMLPIDSVKFHGKLYFAETDTRTHLTGAPNDMPYYSTGIWQGPPKEVTLEIMKMHFARMLTHGHAMWWFDMWGQWYADPDYMDFLCQSRAILADTLNKSRKSIAQMAVFIDERALSHCYDGGPHASDKDFCYGIRKTLGLSGIPYDIYLIDDYYTVSQNYRACIFLDTYRTDAVQNAINRSSSFLIINKDNANITTSELRAFAADAGITLMADRDVVFYACESFLFLHAPVAGEYQITLPEGMTALSMSEGEPTLSPISNVLTLEGKHSYLFGCKTTF